VKRILAVAILAALFVPELQASRVVRTRNHRHGATRVRVTVRPGFPIRRALPNVMVRPAPVIRVAPRIYLGTVAFTAVALASLPPTHVRASTAIESLDREDGWTDFTMNFDQRGRSLALEIDRGPAQISFAEVVFDNGETQVIDFDDRLQSRGAYSLLNFRDGRKVDHVRMIAKAQRNETLIRVHLVR